MLFVKQQGREGGWCCQETPLAPKLSICAGAHPSSSPSPVPTSPTVTCGLHPCPLLPVAESSLTGPGSPALPPARVPGQCLQSQRPRTDHLMTRSLVEPVIRTQSPKMPQQRPRFFRGRSSVVAVTPGITTPRSGQDGPDTTCCPTRGRVPRGTSGPGLSPRDGRHHVPSHPQPWSLPGRWGWSSALDSGTCSGRCSPCRCTRPCGGRRRTGSTCHPLKVSRAQRRRITHRSRACGGAGNANRPTQRLSWRSFLGSSACGAGAGGLPRVGAEPSDQWADPRPTAARGP